VIEWILATRSRGKLAELVPILAASGIVAISVEEAGIAASHEEELIEVFDSFEENALAKARYFSALTGKTCLAEDSGLCIDALDGQPGVRSRRFARDRGLGQLADSDEDDANNEAMLVACWDSGRAPPWRAHFACVAALVGASGEMVGFGRCDGAIHAERSGRGGFGYDPYFVCTELGLTFADASREEKARVSHRARAIRNLLDKRGVASLDGSAR
jgi:XTP/dITP diphosphohydrolase